MEAAWWELFLGIPGDVGKVWACSKAARGGAWFLTSQSSHALGGLLVSLGWNPGLVWLLNNWVVWETPQNLPWERRDHPRCQPWCQFPFYLCQAHASAAGAGTQSLQAGSATSSGAQQPQPGPAAHGDLHPCGHPHAQQVTGNARPPCQRRDGIVIHGPGIPQQSCTGNGNELFSSL